MKNILITKHQIDIRVRELAYDIDMFYKDKNLVVIGVLNGSIIFLADLIRHIRSPMKLDCISASSYGMETKSSELVFHKHLKLEVKGADVLLVDDILDTGKTLTKLIEFFKSLDVKSIETCVFLKKNIVDYKSNVEPKFIGFGIPDRFVYGYGLDIGEKFRNSSHVSFKMD